MLLLRASASILGDVPELRGERENKWLSALQSAGEENTLKEMLIYSGPGLIVFSFSHLEYVVIEPVSVLLACGLYCHYVLCVTCAPAAGLWKGILLNVLPQLLKCVFNKQNISASWVFCVSCQGF